jgi:hypothetical protein
MKNLRVLCWVWIVASTIVILFRAPVSVTRHYSKSLPQVTTIEWIGPFGEPFTRYDVTKSSIDFSRLVVVLLAVNFLPAVLLWQYDKVVRWLERQQRHPVAIDQSPNNEMLTRARARREGARKLLITCVICLLTMGLLLFGVLMKNAKKVGPTPAPGEGSAQSVPVTPPSKPMPTAAPKISPDNWEYIDDPTPTPIRRAIPVTQ